MLQFQSKAFESQLVVPQAEFLSLEAMARQALLVFRSQVSFTLSLAP